MMQATFAIFKILCSVPLLLPSVAATNGAHSHLRGNGHFNRHRLEAKIVGGHEAPLNSYPSYVQWSNGCAGVLIHDDIVITAAHCDSVTNSIQRFPLFVGGDGRSRSGTRIHATAAFRHPRYDLEQSFLYDFLLLKLPHRIDGIPFAPLNANHSYPTNGIPLTVVGHGMLDSEDSRNDAPTIYHEVTVPYIESCSVYLHQVQSEVQFCAGDMPFGGRDACLGDSGSGIFDDEGLLVGLVSWGIGCARPRKPGVYARISAVERWIAHMICQESSYQPAHCTNVQVSLTVDDYPEQIGLALLDYDSTSTPESVVIPAGSIIANPQQTLRYTFSVPKGRNYLLQVEDTGQNGFCCEDGAGEVTIRDRQFRYHLSGLFQSRYASVLLPEVGGSEQDDEETESNEDEEAAERLHEANLAMILRSKGNGHGREQDYETRPIWPTRPTISSSKAP
ncbi:Plasminogen (Fragment) [Seminavis robusta]|uniref:Plasminogen n=1 Tax=Seminavis robusta TaxID=568900 RepID=A0A9N8HNF2_9STRA